MAKSFKKFRTPGREQGYSRLLLSLFLFLFLGSFAILSDDRRPALPNEEDAYEALWEKADSLADKGLYRSALKVVEKIRQKSEEADDQGQRAKALLQRLKYSSKIGESTAVEVLNELDSLSENASQPLRAVFHSITGQAYWSYYQRHRHKIQDRSHTGVRPDDIRTWDLKNLMDRVRFHFDRSLSRPDHLLKGAFEKLEPILKEGDAPEELRPTLYDLLAHRAFEILKSARAGLAEPAVRFTLDDPHYFSPVDEFTGMELRSPDSLSNRFHAFRILQDLLAFHEEEGNRPAAGHVDLKRLKFVHEHGVIPDRDSLYLAALERLKERSEHEEILAHATYQQAALFHEQGGRYDPKRGNERYRWKRKEAREICEQVIEKYRGTYGAGRCKKLRSSILSKRLNVETERLHYPKIKGKGILTHRNIDSVHMRLIQVPWDHYFQQYGVGSEDRIAVYKRKEPIREWSLGLDPSGDHFTKRTFFKIPDLPLGHYILLTASSPEFGTQGEAVSYMPFWVTRMGFVQRKDHEEKFQEFQIVDHRTGEVLEGVEAEVYTRGHRGGQTEFEKVASKSTDKEGRFRLKEVEDSWNIHVALHRDGDDHFLPTRGISNYFSGNERKQPTQTFLFTDRSIYRPGQELRFKGLVVAGQEESAKVRADHQTRVTLYDVNGQKVAEKTVNTNEYGTFSGSFTIPSKGLTGRMRIATPNGEERFRVEEYKRPNFEVTLDPAPEGYEWGDTVKVEGRAEAFTGTGIGHARVRYEVRREPRFTLWGSYRSLSRPERTVAHGSTESTSEGRFTIDFVATREGLGTDRKAPPFKFVVEVAVTDINGETHEDRLDVAVASKPFRIDTDLPASVDRTRQDTFRLWASNLNDAPVAAKGSLQVYRLDEPIRPLRSRYWERPDRYAIERTEFKKAYPYDPYERENEKSTWERERKLHEEAFRTKGDQGPGWAYTLEGKGGWKEGTYLLKMRSGKGKKKVVEERYFTLYDPGSRDCPTETPFWFEPFKTRGRPGEKAAFLIGSGYEDVRVLCEVAQEGRVLEKKWYRLDRSKRRVEFSIKEAYKGNVSVSFTAIRHSRVYQETATVRVPRTEKELDLSFSTFRNRLKPGASEEWRVHIRGSDGEPVSAELLATMYDASLDQFVPHSIDLPLGMDRGWGLSWGGRTSFSSLHATTHANDWNPHVPSPSRSFRQIVGTDLLFNPYRRTFEVGNMEMAESRSGRSLEKVEEKEKEAVRAHSVPSDKKAGSKDATEKKKRKKADMPPPRKDFSETAFFYPHLETNDSGDVVFSFTMPEALTRWNFMALAHTPDLRTGQLEETVVTDKPLMITPNAPRFLRQGDTIVMAGKVSNTADSALDITGNLKLFDALTMKTVSGRCGLEGAEESVRIPAGESRPLRWRFHVPEGLDALTYRMTAHTANFSDGMEDAIPVLPNKQLITETMPLPVREKGEHDFSFEKLKHSGSSPTLRHHKLTLEFSAEPIWYAVQALPTLMEGPDEGAEAVFSRFYADRIAGKLLNDAPRIKRVIEAWQRKDASAFMSRLQKNEDLKSIVLNETPWVMEAKSEAERKKRIATLFDLNRMQRRSEKAVEKLSEVQGADGGWSWFPGMRSDRYITQHIVAGMGHLSSMGIELEEKDPRLPGMIEKALEFMDKRVVQEYKQVRGSDPDFKENDHLSHTAIQYLYARSYFPDMKMNQETEQAVDYFLDQAADHWLEKGVYMEGMLALAAHRYDRENLAGDIMKSLEERALRDPKKGMYWKNAASSYHWYEAPIERHALMILAFDEIKGDMEAVKELQVWLLRQKQTQDWGTSKATARACYALLAKGDRTMEKREVPTFEVGGEKVDPQEGAGADIEAGTGHFRTSWHGSEVRPGMGDVTLQKKDSGLSWGAMYWQYFQDLDKVSSSDDGSPLSLKKELYRVKKTETGESLHRIEKGDTLELGDRIQVRMELRVDRKMEYLHLKDLRGAGLEPVGTRSGYRYQDGLGYYCSIRDASMNYFFDRVTPGTYVLEYPLRVASKGDMSSGTATIQCMYAPEFRAHSEGVRLRIE